MTASWVALDAMGVLYRQRGISPLMVRLAAARGVTIGQPDARDAYRRASRGLTDAAAMWGSLGVPPGVAHALDAELLAGRELTPGAGWFLATMRDAGIPVGCITNDLGEWSAKARRAAGLERLVAPWVVSAEVGVRKPGREIYDAFVAGSGCDPSRCWFVDDTVENLDAARRLGFTTAWFSLREDAAVDHPRVGSFEELAAGIVGIPAGTTGG
jgi:FMN phosphatase YigB (HAD superfamily)